MARNGFGVLFTQGLEFVASGGRQITRCDVIGKFRTRLTQPLGRARGSAGIALTARTPRIGRSIRRTARRAVASGGITAGRTVTSRSTIAPGRTVTSRGTIASGRTLAAGNTLAAGTTPARGTTIGGAITPRWVLVSRRVGVVVGHVRVLSRRNAP
jgi:hypothetical protein